MPASRLEYPLVDGYIHNWLVAGPQAISVPDLDRLTGKDYRLQIARRYQDRDSSITEPPVDRESFSVGNTELTWTYFRCLDDHYVTLTASYDTRYLLRAWAYAQITCPVSQQVAFALTTNGPADLWLNGQHIHRQEHLSQDPKSVRFQGTLAQGDNDILVRCDEVAAREWSSAMALRITGLPSAGVSVIVPSSARRAIRRQMLERIFEQAHLEQHIHYKGTRIMLRWADDLDVRSNYVCQIQDSRNRIYMEALPEAKPSETLDMGHIGRIWEGAYDIVLRARSEEYYDYNLRYERRMPIHVLDNPYSDALYGSFAERRTEALEHASKRGRDVYAEIAKMALDMWSEVNVDRVMETIQGINRREDGSDRLLLGLLGAMYRYGTEEGFDQELKQSLKECVLGFKYWHDEPGIDAMCYQTESHSILFHACEILAGQLYPDQPFSNAGQTGQWHREKGERLALDWLHERATLGFQEWDSNSAFEQDLAALAHLVDFAEEEQLREMAAVVMDKMLLTMALNSFKGVFGSTHGQTSASMVKSGQLEATSGISRLLWAMGVWNHHAMGVVSLALSEYEMPLIIADIAVNLLPEMWNREQHPGVNKVTYRTPDYMLCSAQDHKPGQKGAREHIWQATMGPDAVVFVNHPTCMSEADVRQPSFWCGNHTLPRVAQWKDALVAIHKLPDAGRDWLGFTHAYFPVYDFDECGLQDNWAFARQGSAYLALAASQGIELIKSGPSAYRELRSHGQHNVWLCLMGRAELDGTFEEFLEKVRQLQFEVQGLTVQFATLRGDAVSFGWETPLLVNGEEQPLDEFKHYDGPFCTTEVGAPQMDINNGEYVMRLNFAP
jgi:hypothetical protein